MRNEVTKKLEMRIVREREENEYRVTKLKSSERGKVRKARAIERKRERDCAK